MERIEYELNAYLESQDQGFCKVCDRTLPGIEFENSLGAVCTECESDGYWQGDVFIGAGEHAHAF